MGKTVDLIKAIKILDKYRDAPGRYDIGSEHDVIYLYPPDKEMSTEDIQAMLDAGLHQEYDDRDYNKDMEVKDYREDESWHFYT